jgi:hypothetical protein
MPGTPGAERVVSREEQPVDVNQIARQEPRVVLPAPNQPAAPPQPPAAASPFPPPSVAQAPPQASVQTPPAQAPRAASTEQPKRIKTVAIRGDQSTSGVPSPRPAAPPPSSAPTPVRTTPQAAPPPAAPISAPMPAQADPAGGPLQLSPQGSTGNTRQPRSASAAPPPASANASSGNYVVQVSSQRSEADAQASYRALQGKFPSVLGSRSASVKRVDLGEKGTYYRAVVGPFAGAEEASRVCADLKSVGGQCVVQRN